MKKVLLVLSVFLFLTFKLSHAQIGSDCANPHVIPALPYTSIGMSTDTSGNNYSSLPCSGTLPNYLSGNDYVFSFTPSDDMTVMIDLTNTSLAVGVFVTKLCPDDTAVTCIAYDRSALGNPTIPSVNLTADSTYFIIVGRSALQSSGITDFDIQIIRLLDYDAAVVNILAPTTECYLTASEPVAIEVANLGLNSITGFEIGYVLDGVPGTPETITDIIAPDSVFSYTFAQTLDLSAQGQYDFYAYVILAGDEDASNDTLYKDIAHLITVDTLPYFVDFESGSSYWTVGGNNPSWEVGAPAAPIINTATPGNTQAWVTNLTGNHNFMENSFVYSPCFNFSNYSNVSIDMDIWYETFDMMDGARLEASIDGGSYWFVIGENNEPFNWYNAMMTDTIWTGSSGGWLKAQHPINYAGGHNDVRLRVRYKTGLMSFTPQEGFAFDNVYIYECTDMPTANFTYVVSGNTVHFTNTSTDASAYTWDFGDLGMGLFPDTTTHPSHQYMIGGQYEVTLAAYNECGVSYFSEIINITVGINEAEKQAIILYPNPATSHISIFLPELDNEQYSIKIHNTLGQEVYTGKHDGLHNEIDISNLSNGIYLVTVLADDFYATTKLSIQ